MIEHFFGDDYDIMNDFLQLSKEEFLKLYSYLSNYEYQIVYNSFITNQVEILADCMRQAENLLIEEMHDRPTNCTVTAENLKRTISSYALKNLSQSDYQEFEDICQSMAC